VIVDEQICAEGMFRGLLEAAPEAMVVVDGEGSVVFVNERAELLFGYSRGELLGRCVEVLLPGRVSEGDCEGAGEGLVPRQGGAVEGRFGFGRTGRVRSGRVFSAEVSSVRADTGAGAFVCFTVRDLGERRGAEAWIDQLAAMVESSQDSILATTLDGRITYWNAAAQRLYGYSAEQVLGRNVSLLAPSRLHDEVRELLARVGLGERIEGCETVRQTCSGRQVDVDITLWPHRDHRGVIVGVCSIARDVSEHKRALAELTRLYERERHTALTLQRSLMGTPASIPGLTTASRYLPATQGAGVGGDWFDFVPLGAGRVGIVVGDVMGRGLEAAAVMGQLRSAARALAKTDMSPRQLMQALDAFVADLPEQFVTCCYLVVDPGAGAVTVCSAGHLPVLVAASDATVRVLPAPVSVPLGVGEVPHQQVTVAMPPGSTLVLYSDGLIETPDSDIESRLKILMTELQAALATRTGLEAAADSVLAALRPGADGHSDDVTLLLARLPDAPLAGAERALRAQPVSVSEGRRFLEATLNDWGCAAVSDDALLLASEVLTNAVCHAAGPLVLRLRRTEAELTVEVTDRSAHLPLPRLGGLGDEHGRGLILVDTLAADWGTRRTDEGKTVWFTLALLA
jgi:PAS domain S-box-containing protein